MNIFDPSLKFAIKIVLQGGGGGGGKVFLFAVISKPKNVYLSAETTK